MLRLAVNEDVDRIMEMVKASIPLMHAQGNYQWADDYPNKERFILDIEIGQLWVCVSDDDDKKVIGVGALTEDQGDDYKQLWDISEIRVVPHRICVDPVYRGKGIAGKFMIQAELLAKERGYNSVRVDTNSENKAMQKLFNNLGYKFLGNLVLTGREDLTFVGYEKFFNEN